jgi:glycosyltransferase involved in cell wall biosynthesis
LASVTALRDDPRVTVFIPTYNRAEWLGGAIESVLRQTRRDFRLVVSDNASTDGTPEVVAGFDDPRLSYVRLVNHLDLNEHFNLCFERAQTEYLFVLPDDDRMGPELLERTVAALDANPRAGLAHAQVTNVDRDGAVISAAHDMTGLPGDAVESGVDFIRRTMDMSFRVHASTALIRTAAVSGLRLDPRDFPVTDLGLWMRLALDWDVAFLARPLATYRIHAGAYSAGAAAVTGCGYIETVDRVLKSREAKLRLIDEHGARLRNHADLRRRARRRFRRELLQHAAHATLPDRRLAPTARALAASARLDRRVALEPAAWRLAAGSILGPRGVLLAKRVLRRPRTPVEVTA